MLCAATVGAESQEIEADSVFVAQAITAFPSSIPFSTVSQTISVFVADDALVIIALPQAAGERRPAVIVDAIPVHGVVNDLKR